MTTRVLPKATDTVAEINALLEGLDNPVHKHMLSVVRDHYWAEVVWDVPAIMATLSPTAPIHYRFHGGAFLGLDGMTVETRETTQALYESTRDVGVTIGPMEQMKCAVGANGTFQEVLVSAVFPGSLMPGLADQVDPEKFYLVSWYQSVYNPFDEENRYMTGEIVYNANTPLSIEEVDRDFGKEITGI